MLLYRLYVCSVICVLSNHVYGENHVNLSILHAQLRSLEHAIRALPVMPHYTIHIDVYSLPGCPPCNRLKSDLQSYRAPGHIAFSWKDHGQGGRKGSFPQWTVRVNRSTNAYQGYTSGRFRALMHAYGG